MSYDRQIDQICTHEVVQELLYLADDRRTVASIRPIAAAASVKVRLNGEIDVPSAGSKIPASVIGTREGPFTIREGVNNVLTLRVENHDWQTVVLPNSNRMPVDELATTLNRSFAGVLFTSSGKRLTLRTVGEGRAATLFIGGASTLCDALGLPKNRQIRGVDVVPGWTLVSDPTALAERPKRLIVFDDELPGFNDFVEINYTTARQECRRCGATGMENDWRYSFDGEVVQVVDEALLIQEVQKLFFTLLGSNVFHDWYGTSLLDAIGKKITPGNFAQNLILSDISQAFQRWQSVKQQQEQNVGQYVSDREYPFSMMPVGLQQSTKDPTVVFVKVVVTNRSGDPIQIDRGLRLPSPLALVDPTAAQGQIRQSLNDYVLTR